MTANIPQHTADGAPLPAEWQTSLPVRWVLDPDKPHHCDACLSFAGEYATWDAMFQATNGAVPGFFPACSRPTEMKNANQLVACWDACQCSLQVNISGEWTHVA